MVFDQEQVRSLAYQIVRIMGFEPVETVGPGNLICMIDKWSIYIPEYYQSYIVLKFLDDSMNPYEAADIAMRFCKVFDILNIRVMLETEHGRIGSRNDYSSVTADETVVQ